MTAEVDSLLRGPLPRRLARYAARTGRTVVEAGKFLASVALEEEPLPRDLTYPLEPPSPWPDAPLVGPSAAEWYGAASPIRSSRVIAAEAALIDFGMRLCLNERERDPEFRWGFERAEEIRARVASLTEE